jgi:catechol 2,3-dioxygenase-like lactoylglutathione lyase family enzyme
MSRSFKSFAATLRSQLAALTGSAAARPTPVAQVRFARPTQKLEQVVRFYRDGLGFPVIGSFEDHAGYDGVMLGLPGPDRHLEFTRSRPGDTEATPGPENLLVLYFRDQAERDVVVARLAAMGYAAVPPENPYWIGKAITVPDPDGWRVVLFDGLFTPSP